MVSRHHQAIRGVLDALDLLTLGPGLHHQRGFPGWVHHSPDTPYGSNCDAVWRQAFLGGVGILERRLGEIESAMHRGHQWLGPSPYACPKGWCRLALPSQLRRKEPCFARLSPATGGRTDIERPSPGVREHLDAAT